MISLCLWAKSRYVSAHLQICGLGMRSYNTISSTVWAESVAFTENISWWLTQLYISHFIKLNEGDDLTTTLIDGLNVLQRRLIFMCQWQYVKYVKNADSCSQDGSSSLHWSFLILDSCAGQASHLNSAAK